MIHSDSYLRFPNLLKLLGVAALYALLAKVVLVFFSANGVVSAIWPPSGLALAVLLIGGKRYAWGVFLGALLANAMTGIPFWTTAAISSGNTLEALFGAWLLMRGSRFDPNFRFLHDYRRLVVLAGGISSIIAALIGTTALLVSGFLTTETYFLNLIHWWMGDALGIVLIAPMVLIWRQTPDDWRGSRRISEAMLLFGLAFLVNQVVFLDWFHDTVGLVAQGYWMFLFVTWAAVRLGTHGVLVVLLMTATQALLGGYHGTGFFADDVAKTHLTNYWFYSVSLSVVGMTLAIYCTERKQAERREHIRNQVLEQLAKGAPLPDILDALVRGVEASNSAMLGSILLLDEEGRNLLLGAAPSLPEKYNRAIHGIAIGPYVGSCGTAAFRRERVIVSDISSDPLWADYRELALRYGLQACWSQPILSSTGQVLGTFAIYHKRIRPPNGSELDTISDAANIACIAIEHIRFQQALHIAATTFETQEGIIITDNNKAILRINQSFTRIYGYSIEEVVGTTPSILQSDHHDDEFYGGMWEKLLRDKYWAGEIWDKRKNGEVFPVWLTISAVTAEDGSVTHYVGTFSDITEYKRTQEELLKSETRLSFALQMVHTGGWDLDLVDRTAHRTLEHDRIFGYESPLPQWNYEIFLEHVLPEDRAEVDRLFQEAIATQTDWNFECRIRRADDEVRWIWAAGGHQRYGEGPARRMAGIVQDITEKKRTQEELQKHRDHLQELVDEQTANLRDSAARIHAILDTVVDGIITINERGIVETFNPAAEHIFGYAAAEVVGYNINMLMPEPYHNEHDGYLEHYRVTGEAHVIGIGRIVEGRRKDGSTFPLDLAVSKMQLGEGLFFTGIVRDITARKQFEEKTRQLNVELSRFKGTLDQTLDCVFMFRPDTLLFIYVNEGAKRQVGYSETEMMQMTPLDIKPEFNLEQFRQILLPLVEGTLPSLAFQTVHRHKNGHDIPVEIFLQFIHLEGQEPCFVAVVRDITERKLFEQALIVAKTEAEQACRAKSDFLATMSHEIRTPMNGVIGMIDVLHQSSLKGYQVEMVDLIRESAYSLLDIIEDILDVSKIEAGKLELESAPMPVADVVEKACATLDHLAAKKRVELTLFTDPAIPAEVIGDAGRLRQILINLASNAIKFSSGQEREGRVSVRAVLVKRSPDRAVVDIHIGDNGIGMDEETLSKLFTPFTQADTSTTRRFGGTGLGLAITRHLVELMSGEIAVQSAPGKGSTFIIRLPFVPLSAEADTGKAESPVTGLSCLLVGNSQWLTDDIAAYLTYGGATVERVPDLTAAREQGGARLPGLWVWILDTGGAPLSLDELHAIARTRPEQKNRFVVFERGQRREPRLEDADIVLVDGNMLSRWTVLKAVAIAAGRMQEKKETPLPGKTDAAFSPPSRAAALRQGRLILVAEDNETNQKVILRQLALLGFAADVAGDGCKALERWRSGDYALLLTDLHMPKMDGYELTKTIRAEENGSRRIPIMALTANALKGEAEHCRAIGMDGYLSKPVQLVRLEAMLEKWLPAAASAPQSADAATLSDVSITSATPATASKSLDVSVLAALVGDNPEVISEFLQDFRSSATQIASEMKSAYAAGQAAQMGALAHKLKSSARSVGALGLGELCAAIEQAGKAGQIEVLAALLPHFEAEMAAVVEYLDAL